MKILLQLLALVSITSISSAQLLVTEFGVPDLSDPSGSLTFDIGPTSTNLSGVQGNDFYAGISSINIANFLDGVNLTGTFNSGTATSNFQIQLFDEDGDARIYQGNWTSFPLGVQTTLSLSFLRTEITSGGAFDNIVTSIGLSTSGDLSSGHTINFTADTLTAIPEPSTWALLGLGGLGLILARRRLSVTRA